jgi:hypothetical protein
LAGFAPVYWGRGDPGWRDDPTIEDAMSDIVNAMLTVDDFTFFATLCCVGIAIGLIREMVDSFFLAFACSPFLLMGAFATNYLFRINFIVTVQDKDSSVVIASAVGVIIALMLVLISIWISVSMSERRSKMREIEQLPTIAP